MQHQDNRPWWKHRWPWILMSGPAIAVLGCAVTIWMAYNVSTDAPVQDGVKQHGFKVTDQAHS